MKKFLLLSSLVISFAQANCITCIKHKCKAGDGNACYQLGLKYENALVNPQINRINNKHACTALTSLYADSNCDNKLYHKANYTKALALYRRAASYGYAKGYLGEAIMHVKGEGVPKNIKKAMSLFYRACESGAQNGCYNYALLKDSGY